MSLDTFKTNLINCLDDAIQNDTRVKICTPKGNAILLSENDLLALQEATYLYSSPMIKKIISGEKEPLDSLSIYSPHDAW